ncbi:MAG: shikimate dehydrogenase [Candidatus Altiarchaeota archaeon]|nr:shikimate dehydrogenase [Candidatus Altiarchaeota archaeon]
MAHFGLIGHPVAHSMSKLMHEAAYSKLGLKHTYSLFDVLEEDLGEFISDADYSGLNVTIPHKVEVIKYLDDVEKEAEIIGSVNTIEFSGGMKIGHNTDVFGFMKCAQNAEIKLKGEKVMVLGAGGAGRAISFKLAMEGSKVAIFDTDKLRASALADDITAKIGETATVCGKIEELLYVDVLVNATPVGMHPHTGATPVKKKLLNPGLSIIDIVYNPVETTLIKDARDAGCKVAGGVDMLVYQGAKAFEIWLGIAPPVDVMKKAVLENL